MSWWTRLALKNKRKKFRLEHVRHWHSGCLSRPVDFDVYLPPLAMKGGEFPLLLVNDGQDLPRMDIGRLLDTWYEHPANPPFILVGVYAGLDRIREYGVAAQADYLGRGDLAGNYTRFVLEELLPYLRENYPVSCNPTQCWVAGFSLGALSALDLVWAQSKFFGGAGVFSGALWWRSKVFSALEPDGNRIVHDQIQKEKGIRTNFPKCWFFAGTQEETDDRNQNGVIDVIDDTLDCMKTLQEIGCPKDDLRYVQLEGGTHDPESWGKGMLDFWEFMLKEQNVR